MKKNCTHCDPEESGSFQSSSLPGFYDWKNKSGSLMMMRRKVNSACILFSLSHTLSQLLCYNRFMSKALAEIESHGRKLALERLLHVCSLPLVCVCIAPIWKTKKRSTNVKKQTDNAKCEVQRSRNCFCGIHPSSRCQLSTRHAKGCYKECLPAAWYHVLLSRFSDLPDLHISLGENPEELGWEISESFPFASFISVALPLQQQ